MRPAPEMVADASLREERAGFGQRRAADEAIHTVLSPGGACRGAAEKLACRVRPCVARGARDIEQARRQQGKRLQRAGRLADRRDAHDPGAGRRGPIVTDTEATDQGTSAPNAAAVLEYLVKQVVDNPDDVTVTTTMGRRGHPQLDVRVADGDMGRVIGKRGRIAQSIRTVTRAAAVKDDTAVDIEFVD